MVLSLRTKSRRGPTVQVDYIVHVQEIKPWPPSQSLKSIRSVFIQWENGDRSSGATSIVMPSVDDGKIEFSDCFRLPVVLLRDMSVRSTDTDVFLKNLLEFNLYEPRRDKTVKGQLLGTAIMDLAEYGAVKEITSVSVPINCTRSFRNTAQPILYIKIQPVDKGRSSTSSRGSLAKEASSDNNGIDSVSALMNEEYAEEAELASLTDDDVSSHSSLAASSASGSLALQNVENGSGLEKENHASPSKHGLAKVDASAAAQLLENQKGGIKSNPGDDDLDGAVSSESFTSHESILEDKVANLEDRVNPVQNCKVDVSNSFPVRAISLDASYCMDEKLNFANDTIGQDRERTERKLQIHEKNNSLEVVAACSFLEMEAKVVDNHEPNEVVWQIMEERKHSLGVKDRFTPDAARNQVLSGNDMPFCKDRVKHVKSVRSSMDSARSNGSPGVTFASVERKEAKVYPAERRNITSDGKIQELEHRIQMLEGELREAAAIEVSLYSIVAEHGSSISKVHAPARRLSRLYFLAGKRSVQLRRSSAARNAVSGLVVVAKACGSDVPRLTFWLSNCVMLRAIISQAFAEQLQVSAGSSPEKNGVGTGIDNKSPRLTWRASSSSKNEIRTILCGSDDNWEDPHTFTSSLEKVESWIFLRIVESVWWQTLIPHMQSSAARIIDKGMEDGSRKNYRRASSSADQEQVNFSLELWKRAFKYACERLCPVRAGRHECGCLPTLAKLIMEQCVARLDVAMFNAILRESADDIPTDPLSDPVSDPRVLPIPTGKSSFGAGAQLKNVIGNWSRWLTDLFGMDDDDPVKDDVDHIDDDDYSEMQCHDSSFKSFHLLKSLSDLMMLPKDMLLSSSIRKEVCPTFGAQIIKRVLNIFVPDEFCSDPVPNVVLEALDFEDAVEDADGSITDFPCMAPAAIYSPPSACSLASVVGDVGSQAPLRRSGSSLLRKSITSDDELEELDSPLSSIFADSPQASPTPARLTRKAEENDCESIRYRLLRQVWMNSE